VSIRRIGLLLGTLGALLVLLAAFQGAVEHASPFVEDARGCDWFGYLRQARLFREQGPIGGLDTELRDDRTRYLVELAKKSGLDPDVWDYGVAPYCHHYKPSVDRVVLQYPPGTGFLHSLWPDQGRQARLTFVACALVILLVLVWTTVRARAVTVPLVTAALGAFCFLGLISFVYDRSIVPSAAAAFLMGWLTVAVATPSKPYRYSLAAAFGLLVGLSASIRLPNILLAAGPLLVLAAVFLRRPSSERADPLVAFAVLVLGGLVPLFVANRINAGHPLATTYGSIDTAPSKFGLGDIADGLSFYFWNAGEGAVYLVVAMLAIAAVLAWRARLRFDGAGVAAAMAAVSLLVSLGFMLTHEPHNRYYLFPVAVYAATTAAFCVTTSENAFARAPGSPPWTGAAQLSLGAATLIVLAWLLSQLAMPLSPNYQKPDVTAAFEPEAIVWADRNTGNIVHFLNRQAAVFTFLPPAVRERFVSAIADDGVTQYFVVDSDYMENAVAPFRDREGFRPAGRAFGHDVFVLLPRRAASLSTVPAE
jgi:hypothetical protein